jgi:hypothetical protein
MFFTLPQFEVSGMSAVVAAGQKCWRAVLAEFPVDPWYLFIYEGQVADTRVNLTMLVSWEESLLDIVELVPVEDRRSLYRADPLAGGGLVIREVTELWASAPAEGRNGVRAVLALEGSSELLDPSLRPVGTNTSRRLAYCKAGRAAHAPQSTMQRCD